MERIKIGVNAEHGFNMLKGYLFADRDVFLREIVSNSIDAIAARAIQDPSFNDQIDAEIRIFTDRFMSTISISDNGVGMTREDAINNLGNIFQSSKATGGFIGTFGIGFYSCLKVADDVEILTKSALGDDEGCKIIFDGSDSIRVYDTLRSSGGTEVKIHLKKEYTDDYTNEHNIYNILIKYFKFVQCPIFIGNYPEPIAHTVPLYLADNSFIGDDQWFEFFDQNLSCPQPIAYHVLRENADINGVLVIPRSPSVMQYDTDLKLYVDHVFIKSDANELIHTTFRSFICGLIDAKRLPISLSRNEELESSPELRGLQKYLNATIIQWLLNCAENQSQTFNEVMEYHDQSIKQACIEFDDLFYKLNGYLSFKSSFKAKVTLNDYLDHMAPDQPVFYLTDHEEQGSLLSLYNQKNIDVIFFDSNKDQQLLKKIREFYPSKNFIRIDEYNPSEKQDEKRIIFGISENKHLEVQLRQMFKRVVDNEMDVQLKRLPNRDICSIILKDSSTQMDDVYAQFYDIFSPEIKKDIQIDLPDEVIRSQFVEFMKDNLAPRILILNEINPAIQRLGLLLSQERVFELNGLLESMAKSIYFIALASSREKMSQEQAEKFSQIHSKILDDYGALSLNRMRTANTGHKKGWLGRFIGR